MKDSPKRRRLTIAAIERFSLPPGKREALLWDSEVRHLGVRFREGKQPSFIFMCKFGGRTLRMAIGPTDALTIDQARREAQRLNALLAQGKDPREERRRNIEAEERSRRERRRATSTFGELWEAYVRARSDRWGPRHREDHEAAIQPPGQERKRSSRSTVAGVLWPLLPVPLCELTPELAGELFAREARRRATVAARAFRLFRACLRWAETRSAWKGIIDTAAVVRAAGEHVTKQSNTRDDCLQREQLAAWFEAVQTIRTPAIRAYLQVLLLTGRRPSEIRKLRWADVDFTWNTLRVADKDEGEQVIPLTPYVRKLLQGLPRRNEWVFTVRRGPISNPDDRHNEALARAGLPHLTFNGLRRTFSSAAEWVEMPTGIAAQIQGHKPSATAERHYKRRPIDLLRLWHTRLEAWMLEQAGIEQPDPKAKPLEVVG